MDYLTRMKDAWRENFARITQASRAFAHLQDGSLTIEHYREILRRIYHNTRLTPPIMAAAAIHLPRGARGAVRTLLKHAIAEHGHDELARADFARLGGDARRLEQEHCPPGALALAGAIAFLTEHVHPACLLGYMFYLEYTPVQVGGAYLERLRGIGVPEDALTFLQEHVEVDPAHIKLMETYVAELVTCEADFQQVLHGMRTTCVLYGRMLDEAIEEAETAVAA
jgi:hypothetical protein